MDREISSSIMNKGLVKYDVMFGERDESRKIIWKFIMRNVGIFIYKYLSLILSHIYLLTLYFFKISSNKKKHFRIIENLSLSLSLSMHKFLNKNAIEICIN